MEERDAPRVRWLDVGLSLLVLSGFAVAQPLFDILGRNAEFFLARDATVADLAVLAVVFGIALPLALFVLVGAARLAGVRAARLVHLIVLALLVGILLIPVLRRAPGVSALPGWGQILVALGIGGGAAIAFDRLSPLRTFVRVASPAPVIFALVFALSSPSARAVTSPDTTGLSAGEPVKRPAPIVIVIFDEFPVASLMDADRGVDARLFPSFARLAREGTWFRNAVTVHDFTSWSVPAILSGVRPTLPWRAPTLKEHPNNLFTLLDDTYDVRAFEAFTRLCPRAECAGTTWTHQPTGARLRSLATDLRVVAAHLFLPEDMSRSLPPIDEALGGFSDVAEVEPPPQSESSPPEPRTFEGAVGRRHAQMEQLLASIGPAEQPTLHFLHTLMPHRPWDLLPTGQRYPADPQTPARLGKGWTTDEWMVAQAYQRHLLSVGYADRFLGRLIERLEATGRYDDTLLVVTSDHGMGFRPGIDHARMVRRSTVGEVAAVPLFVKLPSQRAGRIVDRRVESLDILPTIADAIGATIPWKVDGRSALGPAPDRTRTVIASAERTTIAFGIDGEEKLAALARKLRWFRGGDPYALVPPGYGDVRGRRVSGLAPAPGTVPGSFARERSYRSVRPSSGTIPALLEGRIEIPGDADAVIAVALNGRVVAVTRTFERGGVAEFHAMLPPEAFRPGANQVELFVVHGERGARTFQRIV